MNQIKINQIKIDLQIIRNILENTRRVPLQNVLNNDVKIILEAEMLVFNYLYLFFNFF